MENAWKSLTQAYGSLSPSRRKFVVAGACLIAILLLAFGSSHQEPRPVRGQASRNTGPTTAAFPPDRNAPPLVPERLIGGEFKSYGLRPSDASGESGQPQITYSADLAVVTKEFGRARSSMEEILERHRGYTAKLRMVGQPSGSTLAATLRARSRRGTW